MVAVQAVLALMAAMLAGYFIRAWLGAANRREWPVKCGACAAVRWSGPRRQLYVEVWDSYGMQYAQWAVGVGELRHSREPGPWLWEAITREVRRLNAFARSDATRAPTGGAVVPPLRLVEEPLPLDVRRALGEQSE